MFGEIKRTNHWVAVIQLWLIVPQIYYPRQLVSHIWGNKQLKSWRTNINILVIVAQVNSQQKHSLNFIFQLLQIADIIYLHTYIQTLHIIYYICLIRPFAVYLKTRITRPTWTLSFMLAQDKETSWGSRTSLGHLSILLSSKQQKLVNVSVATHY